MKSDFDPNEADFIFEEREEEDYNYDDWNDENEDEDSYCESPREIAYNNPPPLSEMRFTWGRAFVCPYCGSSNVNTFIDGTAFCSACFKWYRYA